MVHDVDGDLNQILTLWKMCCSGMPKALKSVYINHRVVFQFDIINVLVSSVSSYLLHLNIFHRANDAAPTLNQRP